MPTQHTAPNWVKGAIVAIDLANQGAPPATIAFQYNPDTVKRTVTPRMGHRRSDRGRIEALGFSGAPEETFTLDVLLDGYTHAPSAVGEAASDIGIHHLLTALEMLLYPRSEDVQAKEKLLDQGQTEAGGGVYDSPLTLFVWGSRRVLPVQITKVDITEEEFDLNLNPLRAKVILSMTALSYSDFAKSHKGYDLFMAYQKGKEQMAARGISGNADKVIGFRVSERIR